MIYSKDYQYISKRTRQIWANVWMLLTPVILFLMMEHINNPYGNLNIGLKYWIINVAILEIIFIFFYYICFPYRITVIIFYGIGVVFSIANYCVGIFRNGNAIMPSDIPALKTAMNVSSNYKIELPINSFKWISLAIICCVVTVCVCRMIENRMKIKTRICLGGEYYGAAEPPVRCGESHLSGLTEPPHFFIKLLCHCWVQSIYFSHREVFSWVNTFNIDLIGIIRYAIHDGIGKSTFTITDLLVPLTFMELRTKDC